MGVEKFYNEPRRGGYASTDSLPRRGRVVEIEDLSFGRQSSFHNPGRVVEIVEYPDEDLQYNGYNVGKKRKSFEDSSFSVNKRNNGRNVTIDSATLLEQGLGSKR